MNTNKYEPIFQMVANSISKLNLTNSIINLDDVQDLKREFSVVINNLSIEDHDEYKSAGLDVNIKVTISEKTDDPKVFEIDMVSSGIFQADCNLSDDEFTEKLRINGVAALYSIARGAVTNISAQSLVSGKVVLPLVNFVEFARDQNKEEKE